MVPKSIQNVSKNCLKTGHVFYSNFGGLGALQVPLGSLLGLPEPLLGGLWTPKTLQNWRFFMVFGKTPFRCFGSSCSLSESCLAAPGADLGLKMEPKGSQNGAKREPETGQESIPKMVPKRTPT